MLEGISRIIQSNLSWEKKALLLPLSFENGMWKIGINFLLASINEELEGSQVPPYALRMREGKTTETSFKRHVQSQGRSSGDINLGCWEGLRALIDWINANLSLLKNSFEGAGFHGVGFFFFFLK